jgi:phosphomannomutase/phosphoglucomutase
MLARLGRPLSELVGELPRYTVVKSRAPQDRRTRDAVMAEVREALSAEADRVITIDGVKAFYADGWILVRPSGTEPLYRLFAESRDPERARELHRHAKETLEAAVRSVGSAAATASGTARAP